MGFESPVVCIHDVKDRSTFRCIMWGSREPIKRGWGSPWGSFQFVVVGVSVGGWPPHSPLPDTRNWGTNERTLRGPESRRRSAIPEGDWVSLIQRANKGSLIQRACSVLLNPGRVKPLIQRAYCVSLIQRADPWELGTLIQRSDCVSTRGRW